MGEAGKGVAGPKAGHLASTAGLFVVFAITILLHACDVGVANGLFAAGMMVGAFFFGMAFEHDVLQPWIALRRSRANDLQVGDVDARGTHETR